MTDAPPLPTPDPAARQQAIIERAQQQARQREIITRAQEQAARVQQDPDEDLDDWLTTGALILGGLFGVHALYRYGTDALQRRPPARDVHIDTRLPNPQSDLQSATTAGEMFHTMTHDANYVVRNQFDRAYAAANRMPAQDAFADQVNMSRAGVTARMAEFLRTGRLSPTRQTESPFRMQEEFASFSNAERIRLSNGMWAEDQLDSVHRGGTRGGSSGMTDQELHQWRQDMNSDRRMRNLAARYWTMMDDILSHTVDKGYRTNAQAAQLRADNPHYVPNIAVEGHTTWLTRKADAFETAFRNSPEWQPHLSLYQMRARNTLPGTGVNQAVNPFEAAETYIGSLYRYMEHNELRAKWIDTVSTSPDRAMRNSIRQIPFHPAANLQRPTAGNVLSVWRNGKEEFWEFADIGVKRALEFDPMVSAGWLNAMRRGYQSGTTGAWQLTFPFKSLLYDSQVASLNRPAGTSMGMFDLAAQKLTAGRVGVRGDPTSIITALFGVGADGAAKAALRISEWMDASMASRSAAWGSLPSTLRVSIRDGLRNYYLTSMTHMLRAGGGYNAKFILDATDSSVKQLEYLKGKFYTGHTGPVAWFARELWGFYAGIAESLHNGARVGYALQNKGKLPPTRLAAETRRLSGDFQKRGAGSFNASWNLRKPKGKRETVTQPATKLVSHAAGALSQYLTEAVPYGNVLIQTVARMLEGIGANPASYAFAGLITMPATGIIGGAVMASLLGDEYSDYYWSQPGHWRAGHVYLPVPFLPPEQGIAIPIAPELGFIGGMVLEGLDRLVGLRNGKIRDAGQRDLADALANAVGLPAPPFINAMLAVEGIKVDPFALMHGGPMVRELQDERLTPGGSDQRHPNAVVAGVVSDVLQALRGTSVETYVEIANAFAERGEDTRMANAFWEFTYQEGRRLPASGTLFDLAPSYATSVEKDYVQERFSQMQKIVEASNFMQSTQMWAGSTQRQPGVDPTYMEGYAGMPDNPLFYQHNQNIKAFASDPVFTRIKQLIATTNVQLEAIEGSYPHTAKSNADARALRERNRQLHLQALDMIQEWEDKAGITIDEALPYQPRPVLGLLGHEGGAPRSP